MSEVYFIPVEDKEDPSSVAKKTRKLYDRSGADRQFDKGDFIAIKVHFGEQGNTTYLNSLLVKSIADKLKQKGVKPFLIETSTLYRGKRSNAIDHLRLAWEHGFGYDRMGIPIIMADGLFGDSEITIKIDGYHYSEVNIAAEVAKVQGLMVISHFTGHVATGFGSAIKNIGMGLSSRKGKLRQHSVMSPSINPTKCTACGMCIKWCPQNTISMKGDSAFIHKENCIGCGECLAVCKFGAVIFDWNRESKDLQELMAEHAAGVIRAVEGKIFFFTYLYKITKDCDCEGGKTPIISRDIGIVAGTDIVAVEKASFDIFKEYNRGKLQELAFPHINPLIQVEHAERIGLGNSVYKLINV